MNTQTMYSTVFTFMERHLQKNISPVLVTVSGGVDSVVLLHLLKRYAEETDTRLEVVHVHHGLRQASDAELEMVESICQDWNLPLHVRFLNIRDSNPGFADGIEAEARRLRYAAFIDVASQVGAVHAVLGHHLDDQAETMLWRMVRGTSLDGLAGIRAVSSRAGVCWLRPLLHFEKKDLYAYAREHGLVFAEDESNSDPKYTRNFIRHQVVAKLRELQPSAVKSMGQLASLLQEDEAWMTSEAECWVQKHASCDMTVYHIPVDAFQTLPRPLQRRVIKIILYCLTSGDLSLSHMQSVVDLASSDSPSVRVTLPNGLVASRCYGTLTVGRSSQEPYPLQRTLSWELEDQARLHLDESGWPQCWEFICRSWTPSDGIKAISPFQLKIPGLVKTATIRTYQPGDRIAPIGLDGHTKKLQDVFTDAKVHRQARKAWPVFCFEDEIIWVPGIIRSGSLKLTPQTEDGWVIETIRVPSFMSTH